mmetsp:Transcript_23501/g.47790  ORF Transcript_23501/g.47790 Transcript_23501/m.47790 type:complete len:128 (-) Transcript_23501:279-662(-)|eukprot:CAMPEP_0119055854 /NCGR_PEP_ID=MMETSP1178-20130426/514_1 /TAXON_ID=33656 /ORGANISM="unid sp, Strain CCMP2000" /LENGTH=127 /DNA_ID=CAMNT_0007036505 /DNA_START=74 /DNA_END=457 /DNA_ORIENTATION=+
MSTSDKIVIAELDFDDWDFSATKGNFEAPYDATKTALTREEWDAAINDVNGVMKHEGAKGLLCCLCGDASDHVGDLKKKCRELTAKHAAKGAEFSCKVKEDDSKYVEMALTGFSFSDDKIYLIIRQK